MSTHDTMEFTAAAATASADVRQLRRGLRAVLRQGGGVMLMRLGACGATVRMDAELLPQGVSLRVVASSQAGASAVRHGSAALQDECARACRTLERLEIAAPAPAEPPAAPVRLPRAA